jgi:hypothetical protein
MDSIAMPAGLLDALRVFVAAHEIERVSAHVDRQLRPVLSKE